MYRGFLGTAAPWSSDATLIAELGMGVALLVGAMLARRGGYRAHAWCQSIVVLLNLVAIALTMVPSFHRSFAPLIPASFLNSYYVLAAAHAALGTLAELFALYILLMAGTDILPKRLRFTPYVPWMRTALALWWATLLFGLATYVRWYVVPVLSERSPSAWVHNPRVQTLPAGGEHSDRPQAQLHPQIADNTRRPQRRFARLEPAGHVDYKHREKVSWGPSIEQGHL